MNSTEHEMAKLSLQEQLLKAGLINEKKLKKVKKGSKKSRDLAREVKAGVEISKQALVENRVSSKSKPETAKLQIF